MKQIIQRILPWWFYLISRDEHFSKSPPVNIAHLDIVTKFHSITINLLSISHHATFTKQKKLVLVSSNFVYSLLRAPLNNSPPLSPPPPPQKSQIQKISNKQTNKKIKQSNSYVHMWIYQNQCISL